MFDRETKAKARRSYWLLILDGHGSHVNMKFINFCDDNKILLAIYPPHSTHSLQPLDVCLFRPLSQAYSNELAQFMYESQGLCFITKQDFFRLFNIAWKTAFNSKNIKSGFEKCGIHPFDPCVVVSKFSNKEEERPSSSESSGSVLSAKDWRRIEKLLHQVVEDIYDSRAQKLSNSIHSLSVQNMLLKMQNEGLKKQIVNEKKKRKRGKPLLLEPPKNHDGGALFWSPNKVQQARERQAQKDEAAEVLRQQKEDDWLRKEAEKAEKARMLEERKRMRSTTKEIRLQQQQEKQRQKEEAKIAKQANQQLQNEIKSIKKGKKKGPSPPLSTTKDVNVEQSVVEVARVLPAQNRRGRQINLPMRYCS